MVANPKAALCPNKLVYLLTVVGPLRMRHAVLLFISFVLQVKFFFSADMLISSLMQSFPLTGIPSEHDKCLKLP